MPRNDKGYMNNPEAKAETSEDFLSDVPLIDSKNDKFQRHPFSKRVAETILDRSDFESLVLGLYGAWGEGKTTVLNFIRSEISIKEPQAIQITFNPWRFTDETTLLISFFNSLALALNKAELERQNEAGKGKSFLGFKKKPKQNLKNTKESIGAFIGSYAHLLASTIGAGDSFAKFGDAMASVDVETLKSRIETKLKEHQQKIIIYIDDIDRLDKDEIHAIFRLVKLTGNFAYTTYVLSFDNDKVAEAIGERFGAGNNKQAGQDFLEKIIQVPLILPQAQKAALQEYCIELVRKTLEANNIPLAEKEGARFFSEFKDSILLRLSTPRLACRFSNTIAFSLPLLVGEVNTTDLLLIEALRIFYPEHYEMVRSEPELFLDSYSGMEINTAGEKHSKDIFKDRLAECGHALSDKEKEAVRGLLVGLFPQLEVIYDNWHKDESIYDKWYKGKRVCSPYYFKRYFTYTVIKGEISDVDFNSLIAVTGIFSIDEIKVEIGKLIGSSTPMNFLVKLDSVRESLRLPTATNLSRSLALLGDLFPPADGILPFASPRSQAALFIFNTAMLYKEGEERFKFINELLELAQPYDMAFEIFRWCRNDIKEHEIRPLTDEEYTKGFVTLKDRAIKEAEPDSIYNKFPEQWYYLGSAWFDYDKEAFQSYVKTIVEKEPKKVLDFIRSRVSIMTSSARSYPYRANFGKKKYEEIIMMVDRDYLHEKIVSGFGPNLLSDDTEFKVKFEVDELSDEDILKHFLYWYSQEKSESARKDK